MTPTRFGSYELVEKMAVGGMAEVFRAKAVRAGGVTKTVCLKRIHPSLCADPSFVGMFIEEARLGLTLSHGNIVPVFDFGCIDGHHFIVMDFVEGRDLASVMARGRIVARPFPPALAVHVVLEVLEALYYAHGHRDEAGRKLEVVHRDISPSNVMVSRVGEVKILDFGIARSALREIHTRTGVVKGKPGYMAPEQARGGAVDARADLFACGVLLHELLTGRRPFEDDDVLSSQPHVAVSEPELEAIIERALAPEPADRFESARQMAAGLAAWLDEQGARPSAAELADHVTELFGAPASAPDWSLGEALDRHLAAQVTTGESEGDEPATAPMVAADPRPAGPSTDPLAAPPLLGPNPAAPAGRRRRLSPWVLLGGVGAASFAVAIFYGAAPERPAAPHDAGAPRAASARAEPATVEVRTQPEGATVSLDGQDLEGGSPLTLSIEPGRHDVEVRLAGYGTLRRSVMARSGQLVAMDVVLQPVTGSLVVRSRPPGAKVLLDGVDWGSTPVTIGDLDREARYDLRVDLDAYEPWSRSVSLEGRRELVVEAALVLEPRRPVDTGGPGFLSVNAHPWAEVLVDGRVVGQTPIVRHGLPSGRHRVVLRNSARGAEVVRLVTVEPDRETRVVVDLTAASP